MGDLVTLIDRREQRPLDLSPCKMEPATLAAGDYSVRGIEHLVAIERKSAEDLIACVGRERDRFEACLQRLRAYPMRAIVVEASWTDLEAGKWRGQITPAHVFGSILKWMSTGIVVAMVDNRRLAARVVRGMLFYAARDRWNENMGLCDSLRLAPRAEEEAS